VSRGEKRRRREGHGMRKEGKEGRRIIYGMSL